MPDSAPFRKGVYILPNLMTTASLFFGFVGITWAIDGRYDHAALAVLASALFDGLDGKIARLTNTASEFGVQYDSLADLVAFGLAPALLMHQWALDGAGRVGLAACFLFAASAALRLARFNVQTTSTSKKFFVGLPSPAGGCTLASLVLIQPYLPEEWGAHILPLTALVLCYVLSFLMVSRVRYASFKEYGFLKAHPFGSLVSALLLFVLVASHPKLLLFPMLALYMVSGPIYTYIVLPRQRPGLLREGSPQ